MNGGRGTRYGSRRDARGATVTYAPRWSDKTATIAMRGFEEGSKAAGVGFKEFVLRVLSDENPMGMLGKVMGGGMTVEGKAEVSEILRYHGERIAAGIGTVEVFMKPLYVRRAKRRAGKAGEIFRWARHEARQRGTACGDGSRVGGKTAGEVGRGGKAGSTRQCNAAQGFISLRHRWGGSVIYQI